MIDLPAPVSPVDDVESRPGRERHVAGNGEAGDSQLFNHRCSWRC